jgi:hypothetical protein
MFVLIVAATFIEWDVLLKLPNTLIESNGRKSKNCTLWVSDFKAMVEIIHHYQNIYERSSSLSSSILSISSALQSQIDRCYLMIGKQLQDWLGLVTKIEKLFYSISAN